METIDQKSVNYNQIKTELSTCFINKEYCTFGTTQKQQQLKQLRNELLKRDIKINRTQNDDKMLNHLL